MTISPSTSLTAYHAKYLAYDLTRRFPPGSSEKLAGTVVSAQVDLNPHQVEAALFAFKSPLSKGALLADEVGLGKTIEAGLVLSQKWAEGKRRILVITPSNLRKQWFQELTEKFFLPCRILESKSFHALAKQGHGSPFVAHEIIICSYQFARSKAADIRAIGWDIVVIDEAHRLRNVYKPSNVIANTLKQALAGRNKLLLTATPLQNSLLELFGLVSFIDEHTFGDVKSFREQFANLNQAQVFHTLKARLKPICHRTLRRQVTAYIPYTKRLPLVEEFTPEASENQLYELVSEYLRRDDLQALPASQRSLITLVLRKLLASSTFAIAGALTSISNRLKAKLQQYDAATSLEDVLDADYEALIERAKGRDLPVAEICFDYSHHDGKITALEPLVGSSGWLALAQLSVETLDQGEDHLILAAMTDDGQVLAEDVAARLMTVGGTASPDTLMAANAPADTLAGLIQSRQQDIQQTISERNAHFFEAEAEKLDGWADDLKSGLERDIKDLDRQIKEARRAATIALTLEEKLAGQKQVKALESQRNQKRRSLFDAQDDVDRRRSELIELIEGKLQQQVTNEQLFVVRWTIK